MIFRILFVCVVMFLVTMAGYAQEPATGWQVDTESDPITDVEKVTAYIVSESTDGGFVVRCDEDKDFSAYFVWDDYLGSDGIDIIWRFPPKEPQHTRWNISTNGKAVFVFDPKSFADMLLMNLERDFFIRLTPYNEGPSTEKYRFPKEDTESVFKRVYSACGMKFPKLSD